MEKRLRNNNFLPGVWLRNCDECGHIQKYPNPPKVGKDLTDAFVYAKCKKCGSEALDYGCENNWIDDDWLEEE